MVETFRPSDTSSGTRRARSVVLPEPLQPASPITFIPSNSTETANTARHDRAVQHTERSDDRLLGGHTPRRRSGGGAGLRLLLLGPERVVFLRPVHVDLAGAHGVERAL